MQIQLEGSTITAPLEFRDQVLNHLLPQFCDDPSRLLDHAGFRPMWSKVSENDAFDFLKGLEAGVVKHVGGGDYRATRSHAIERFFWEGRRNISPRPITLWIEPIITVAVLFRLHHDFAWPKDLIGAQSKNWEFDAAAYLNADDDNEYVACEVKKTERELHQMIETMMRYVDGTQAPPLKSHKENNAYQKIQGLRKRKARLFWAVGPDGLNSLFRVSHLDDRRMLMEPADCRELAYPGS